MTARLDTTITSGESAEMLPVESLADKIPGGEVGGVSECKEVVRGVVDVAIRCDTVSVRVVSCPVSEESGEVLDAKGPHRACKTGGIARGVIGKVATGTSGRVDACILAVPLVSCVVGTPTVIATTIAGMLLYGGIKGAALGAFLPLIPFAGVSITACVYLSYRSGKV
ncbi:MAG: hypothetical protein OXF02_07600 [Simkaniaceae bacterium]|nr:hypothetical protein [Simkaniaceae bacterium]